MEIENKFLFRVTGKPLHLFGGDVLAWERFIWVKENLPKSKNKKLLDVGCGKGSFSMYASGKGYSSLGLTWDKKDCDEAVTSAKKLNLKKCEFEQQDVRYLDGRTDLFNKFDVVLCTENIEHILDDKKLMNSMYSCLKKGGIFLKRSA